MRAIARGLLASWPPAGTRDVVADFATPLAVSVISETIGVPSEDGRLERWTELFFYLFGSIPSVEVRDRLDAALVEFRAFLAAMVAERRERPRDDVLSALLAPSGARREEITDAQVVDNCMLLIADGVGNVDRAIGNAVYSLLMHPEELARIQAQPELLPSAVDECLRFESAAQYIGRVAAAPVEYGGVAISEGATVLLALGSANRDPRAFDVPDRFDVGRRPNPHVSFGWGAHSCIGGPLVELQLRVALECLLEALPGLRLAGAAPAFLARPGHRWVDRVPVAWG